jgi:long-chain fatty acid transport protein
LQIFILILTLKSWNMKKSIVLLVAALLSVNLAWGGGIMTNTNQSASYIRMPVRDASLGIDAVYYNPAGVTSLADGFHLSLNNQSIFQNRTINNDFPLLNQNEFAGSVTAPLFPSVYAAYKTGNLAVSFGFMPVGGGGGAVYEDGLPSFETGVSGLVPMLQPAGVTAYRNDIHFEGSSVFFGGQLGVSYAVNEVLSFFGGARYVMASNSYEGYLRNIEVNTPAGWMKPGSYLRNVIAPMQTGMEQAVTLATANVLDEATADIAVEAAQKGSGITPVLGVSIRPTEQFNIGIKYEFLTKLELENETTVDGTGMFPNGAKIRSDMPAMLSVGAGYQATPQLNLAAGAHYYFDRSADYGKVINGVPVSNKDVIDNNFVELGFGLEYSITNSLLVSGGYLRTITGVNEKYHNDLSHSLSTNNFGVGGRYAINNMVAVNLGFLMSFYDEDSRTYGNVNEVYNRENMVFAIGVDLKF